MLGCFENPLTPFAALWYLNAAEFSKIMGLFADLLEGPPQLEHHVLLGGARQPQSRGVLKAAPRSCMWSVFREHLESYDGRL